MFRLFSTCNLVRFICFSLIIAVSYWEFAVCSHVISLSPYGKPMRHVLSISLFCGWGMEAQSDQVKRPRRLFVHDSSTLLYQWAVLIIQCSDFQDISGPLLDYLQWQEAYSFTGCLTWSVLLSVISNCNKCFLPPKGWCLPPQNSMIFIPPLEPQT